MVTSSAVVGSSAMITSGSLAMAMAIMARCRMPPENSCGKDFTRTWGLGMPTRSSSSTARFMARGPGDRVVHLHGLDDLVADGVDGGQRRQRVLEDHRELVAAQLRHRLVAAAEQLVAVQLDRAGDLGCVREQAHDRQRGDRLAGAGLADDRHRLAGGQGEVETADGAHRSGLGRERDVQVADLQHGAGGGPTDLAGRGDGTLCSLRSSCDLRTGLGSRASRRPSPTAFTLSTSSTTTTAGPVNSHGKLLTCRAPSPSRVPSEVSGACTPKPKNDSPVSARIAAPTFRVASMISSEEMFGRMCRTMVLGPDSPMNRAAWTYSRSLIDIESCARPGPTAPSENAASSSTSSSQEYGPFGPPVVSSAISRKDGMTSSRSITHSAIRSNQPP